MLAAGLRKLGFALASDAFFDTVSVDAGTRRDEIIAHARAEKINFRVSERTLGIALDDDRVKFFLRDGPRKTVSAAR